MPNGLEQRDPGNWIWNVTSRHSIFRPALERLLNGPAYHGEQAIVMREEANLKNWISIAQQRPPRAAARLRRCD